MAFAFSRINKSLGQDDEQKQDIFGQQGASTNTLADQQQQQNGAAPLKTSTEGDIGAANGTPAGAPPGQAPSGQQEQQTAGRAALRATTGKVSTPGVVSDVGGRIDQAQKSLQDEANSYVTGEEGKQTYDVGNTDIEKALGGDQAAGDNVRGLFGRQTLKDISAFAPKTNVEVDDAERLKSDPGLQELLARGQGPSYNKAESAFDLRALRRTPGFDQALKDVDVKQEAARQSLRDIGTTTQKTVDDYGHAQLSAAQKAARDYLTTQQQTLETGNRGELDAYTAKLDALKKAGLVPVQDDLTSAVRELRGEHGDLDSYFTQLIDQGAPQPPGVSDPTRPDQYVSYDAAPGQDAFYDQGEATRFNNIMGLLGSGGTSRTGSAAPGDPRAHFDKGAYKDALLKAAQGLVPAPQDVGGPAPVDANGNPIGPYPNARPVDPSGKPIDPNAPAFDEKGDSTSGSVAWGPNPGAGHLDETSTPTTPARVPQPGDPDYVPDWADPGNPNDNQTAHWNIPGGGKIPIGITEGDKKGINPAPIFTQIAKGLSPIAEGARDAGVHPTQIGDKLVEGVGNVGEGIKGIGAGIGNVAGQAADVGKATATSLVKGAAQAPAKLSSADAANKIKTNLDVSLRDILSNGENSQFYTLGRDPRTVIPGFWDAVTKGGYDTNVIDKMITNAMSGKGNGDLPTALAAAKKKAPVKVATPKVTAPKVAAPKVPIPAFDLPSVGGVGSGEIQKGVGVVPSFSQIQNALARAGGDASDYLKQKGGSVAATAKKILGRG